ncbi:MAG: transcription-repair coupling factor [Bacteroidales bacterium]|nr:transcription-repair coupling factor [Bacteroidales bacterium]MCM1147501.1 transcription-repair coupling factor [Bacteroidales bacterium]MCM1206170.1 transcription-repair coupling factor [Bacillota bacterium]MCM1509998.1 transcription-repair coupling factor [Clostridium sp.]
MKKNELLSHYTKSAQVGALVKTLSKDSVKSIFLEGLSCSAVPLIMASVCDRLTLAHVDMGNSGVWEGIMIFVLNDADEAGYMYSDLCRLVGEDRTLFFPSSYKRAVKYGQHDPANEISRTEVLAKLSERQKHGEGAGKSFMLIVTYPEALAELVVSRHDVEKRKISLTRGQHVDIVCVEHQLRDLGFMQVDYVYEPGQFAVRGSIVDVYSFSSEFPIRIDFFDDEIDTIRTFEVENQLSKERKEQVVIVPQLSMAETDKRPLTSFFPDGTPVIAKDVAFVTERVGRVFEEGFSKQALTERLSNATEMEQAHIMGEMRRESQLCTQTVMQAEFSRMKIMEYGTQIQGDRQYDARLQFHIVPQPLFHKNFELLRDTLRQYVDAGYIIGVLADSKKQVERLSEILSSDSDNNKELSRIDIKSFGFTLHEGFIDNDNKRCLFTDHQIFDRFHKYSLKSDNARHGKMALTMKELQEMEPGDFIVHVDFGIGKFAGLVRVPVGNSYQEVIRIVYQNNDKVDVSIHSLYKISKYRSSTTGEPPRLSHLGTGAWERLKERAKKKIKDIARDLIRLYAKRRHEKGFKFSPDSYLQNELEASFLYEDTPDQLKATQEVKHDMESARPMDRLVCGDVGFGKTEVAIRAAFKAACDSKQVAVLVPTTVLAFQHYKTFKKRLDGLPVRVDYLSRARTVKQTSTVLKELSEGKIDILVGTHKLIGKSVKWKDLGLLIIDEEQKFGVSTKEKLRQVKTNIDTLTMSATPIPRTLQFSLMGARDMSIMRTPPPNRHPIHTELGTYGHEVIADAIEFEMSRNGQVFFVNPRISNLTEIARLIEKHVPDCRIAIGHGQMNPDELEKIIIGFMNHDYDVLLSTTIVENGIDIPNANTIIINDAHKFGLSDLHQMRGRVGRGNKKAFCYLLSPPLSYLSHDAKTRLEALETFSDLGSGFSLAMQDLDLRGAGNLLGAEQSGFMEDLGYETYQKILKQAVQELKNEEFQDLQEEQLLEAQNEGHDMEALDFVDDCGVESDLEMFFPDQYVPGSAERMLLYRELDKIETDRDLEDYRKRLEDRFGPVPHEGEELMSVVMLRRLGKRLGCEKIVLKQKLMQLHLLRDQSSPYYKTTAFGCLIGYATSNPRRCQFKSVNGSPRIVISNIPTVGDALKILSAIMGKR